MIILDPKYTEQMEKLEAEILRTITKVHKVVALVKPLQDDLMNNRAKLRNLLSAYKTHRTQPEIDDLLFAIIRDNALSREDIQIVFDLNDSLFFQAIQRMRDRDT